MTAIFVSPHPDDVALSCGGTVARHTAAGGRAVVVTVFAGVPALATPQTPFASTLHRRWFGTDVDPHVAMKVRRAEDAAAVAILRAEHRPLDHMDAIYRGASSRDQLFRPPASEEDPLLLAIVADLVRIGTETKADTIYLPLAFGLHIDHVLCAMAAPRVKEQLKEPDVEIRFFEDFPYAARSAASSVNPKDLESDILDVTPYIDQRLAAIRCYASQLESLFGSQDWAEAVLRFAGGIIADKRCRFGERLWRQRVASLALE